MTLAVVQFHRVFLVMMASAQVIAVSELTDQAFVKEYNLQALIQPFPLERFAPVVILAAPLRGRKILDTAEPVALDMADQVILREAMTVGMCLASRDFVAKLDIVVRIPA